MRLKPLPSDGRFYCGPGALAAISGEHPKGRIRSLINEGRDHKPNQGVCRTTTADLQFVLYRLGFRTIHIKADGTQTFEQWTRDRTGLYIVNVTGHWISYDGSTGHACDNLSRIPRPVAVFDGRRKRVKGFLRILSGPDGTRYLEKRNGFDQMAGAV